MDSRKILCTICLGPLNVEDETIIHSTNCGHIFHFDPCLTSALRSSSSCPHCRKPNIQHFQLFFEVSTDDEELGAVAISRDAEFLSKQISQISKKLDNISTKLNSKSPRRGSQAHSDQYDPDGVFLTDQLQRENRDLKEILEMEKILSINAEKEIDQLKNEVRERNDIINALQLQNDELRGQVEIFGISTSGSQQAADNNLLDL